MEYIPNINAEDTAKILSNAFNQITESVYPDNVEQILLGYVYPIEVSLFVVKFMSKWVDAIDIKLEKLESIDDDDKFADWFGIRGFTYGEFRLVMETKISEEKIARSDVYNYLYLDDIIAVEKFRIKYSDSNRGVRENYVQALRDSLENEIPFLYEFLCKKKRPLKYPLDNFKRHTYVLAQSSAGKSEYLKNLIFQILYVSRSSKNKSVVLIEPHKDLSKDVLRFVLNKDHDRVVYLDPDIKSTAKELLGEDVVAEDCTFSINPFDLQLSNRSEIEFMTEHISNAFFGIIESTETFQMKAIIEACVETLILKDGTDIMDLKRFMNDDDNADLVEFGIKNLPKGKRELMKSKFLQDKKIQITKSSIYYRLQSLLGKTSLTRVLGGRSTVDLEGLMNSGKLIICNFSKGKFGPDGAKLLGKLTTALLSGFAMQREKIKKEDRFPTFIFMDEFQNYVHQGTTEQLLSEQRKYASYLFLSNQQMGQNMSSEMRRLIAGNATIKYMGENEPESVQWMAGQMKGLKAEANFDLPKYAFYFYDKFKKAMGSFILRSPTYLIDQNSKYYLNDEELKKLILYLVNESGLYRKIESSDDSLDNPISFEHNFTD